MRFDAHCKVLLNRKIKFIFVLFLGIQLSCVSGSIRQVNVSQELPKDLPKDLKDKFDIRETQASVSSLDDSTHIKSEGKKKKNQKRSRTPSGDSAKPQSGVFKYPVRRPLQEPIWVGEKLVFSISYFGMAAGDFTLEVLPHKFMNRRKVYHLRGNAISSAVFSLFYRLNDVVESFVDYESFFSHRFHIVLDETKQSRDSIELNDAEKGQTYYWNRWDHKVNGYSETKLDASIERFSQDSMSALYYVRTMPLPTGAVVTFPVVSEGKNWEAVCTVVRREEVDSPLGKVKAIVIQPEMKYQGILKKSGDSFLWLTDDDRKLPLRLEAKVKIGTVVASLKKVELGTAPQLQPEPSPSVLPVSLPSASPQPSAAP
jgi:hypothetical protein